MWTQTMLEDLVLFLRLEVERGLWKCGQEAVGKYMAALDDVEWQMQVSHRTQQKLALPNPRRTIDADADAIPETQVSLSPTAASDIPSLLDSVLNRIQDSARQGGVDICWIHMYVDAALAQGLGFVVSGNSTEGSAVKALNDLDRATIVGGASGERLEWIHRLIDKIESADYFAATAKPLGPRSLYAPLPDTCSLSGLEAPEIAFPIKRLSVEDVDVDKFLAMIWDADAAQPFVIEGAISFWPALSGPRAWRNLEYLRAAVGHHRLVPVETGAKYTDEGWSQKLMPFGDFLDTIVYPPQNTTRPESGAAKGYLAQHNLFTQAFRLKRDFSLPDYTQVETGRRAVPEDCTNDNSGVLVNAWLGPRGTVSPLHYDKYDNLFAQVVGCKYVRMYAPSETGKMYPHPPESMLSNTSQVDAEAPDLQRFGMFSQALYLECIVQPGDLLYVPPSWWHYLRSLSASASISMWF